jgi:hypothetical protein
MKILRITATAEHIRFDTDFDAAVKINAYTSAFCTQAPVFSAEATAKNGFFTLPLQTGGRDGRFLYYLVSVDGKEIEVITFDAAKTTKAMRALTRGE